MSISPEKEKEIRRALRESYFQGHLEALKTVQRAMISCKAKAIPLETISLMIEESEKLVESNGSKYD